MPLVKLGVTKPNSHHKVLVPLKYDKKIKSLEGIVKEATFANKIFMGKPGGKVKPCPREASEASHF